MIRVLLIGNEPDPGLRLYPGRGAGKYPCDGRHGGGGVFIACGKQTSLIELAAMLSAITGGDLPPVYAGPRAGDVQYSVADIGKARVAFGYEPAWTMRDGLEETVEWFSATCRSGASFP